MKSVIERYTKAKEEQQQIVSATSELKVRTLQALVFVM